MGAATGNCHVCNLEPIKEIIEIRKVISHAVCELITYRGLSDDEVAEFHTILDGMMNASKEEFAEYDICFHRKLMYLKDNTLVEQSIG